MKCELCSTPIKKSSHVFYQACLKCAKLFVKHAPKGSQNKLKKK